MILPRSRGIVAPGHIYLTLFNPQGKELETCVRCGIWAATKVIQRSGCTFPDQMDFK